MLLDPWLLSYVSIMWDRWECIRVAFEEHGPLRTYALPVQATRKIPANYNSFIETILLDKWNHDLFLDVIRAVPWKECTIESLDVMDVLELAPPVKVTPVISKSIKWRIADVIDQLLCSVSHRNTYMFVATGFPPLALTQLMISLSQVPCFHFNEFNTALNDNHNQADLQSGLRAKLRLSAQPNNNFESFLLWRLVSDIPKCWVEKFSALRDYAMQVPYRPKVIATGYAHWGNEAFQVWAAERTLLGARLLILDHGGSIHARFDSMEFENEIAYSRPTWVRPYHPKQVQLPPNKLVTRSPPKLRGNTCTVIGFEGPRYVYRATAAPVAGQSLVGFSMVCALHSELQSPVRENFRIKPYVNLGWDLAQRYREALGAKVVLEETDLRRVIEHSKILICTYPNTTFSEAMASGRPTFLFYPPNLWETVPVFDSLLNELRDVGIIYDQPAAIARRLESIWADPLSWWESPLVRRARDSFHKTACRLDNNWRQQWVAYMRQVANSCS